MRTVHIFRDEAPGDSVWIVRLLVAAGMADSKREARQLISRGMVKVDGQKVTSSSLEVEIGKGVVVERYPDEGVLMLFEEGVP
ncbi:MAG: S4 domain-containing protein [Candidatus Eremiobacteraeota bacterium]|nr:S4 domain-containing protein [Candidatus Eremiobacteraeota bacterium]